jgi:cell division protein FtsN
MSDKPSLYVVERKEVIILVILFVLVTVLSFTMGVRYGESVGKKAAKQLVVAEREQNHDETNPVGGSLADKAEEPAALVPAKEAENKAEHANAAASGSHSPSHAAKESTSPEAAAKEEIPEKLSPQVKEAVDKNSDEFLLKALKEEGVEPPGGKSPGDAKLPQEQKKLRAGTYVIQVGSHQTRGEAESQVRQLKGRQVDADILPPFKDRQGEWHRVVLGNYKVKREAEKIANGLKSKGVIVSFFVWRLP